ncbi:MAG: hypothetical protein P1P85_04160 [Patescibacteria group bacterium]|nr:hypothetical protein [Patescibacteria group bacterium]
MAAVIICERFGWTYEEYRQQPFWFIELLKKRTIIDNKKNG